MKYLVFLMIINPVTIYAMEVDEELRPKYHINNSVVFLQKSQEQDHKNTIETQWKDANPPQGFQGIGRHTPVQIATIDNGVSNKLKVAIAIIGGCSTVTAAIIAGLVTYYSAKC